MNILRSFHLSRQSLAIVLLLIAALISGILWLASIHGSANNSFSISSPSFKAGGSLNIDATCNGADINPSLAFKNIPPEAKSLAILVEDLNLSKEIKKLPNSALWLVFNIPPTATTITEGIRPPGTITRNYKGNFSYAGPCPKKGESHTVVFRAYALSKATIMVNSSASVKDFQKQLKGLIIAQTELKVRYTGNK